ncbi:MAG: Crp/Fnr family transcriptional regulator [Cocleimonas sp.]
MSTSLSDSNLLISNRAKQLENIDFFEGMSMQELAELAGVMKIVKVKKNTIIINQGDLSRSLFVIIQGRLKVSATDEEGNQTIFTFMNDGDLFGELSLLSNEPRSASVSSVEDCTLLTLDHSMFKDFMNAHPAACWSVFKSLTNRIRSMDEQICLLTSKDIYGRLIETLYNHAEENSEGVLITQKLTHQDFAEMVGSSREMISRTFKDLKEGGYISVEKKQISILKRLPRNR